MTEHTCCLASWKDGAGDTIGCTEKRYAKGCCLGHYTQQRRAGFKGFRPLREKDAAPLVQVLVRISKGAHDQLLLAAMEQGVSPYALHQQMIEAWAEKRVARLKAKKAAG